MSATGTGLNTPAVTGTSAQDATPAADPTSVSTTTVTTTTVTSDTETVTTTALAPRATSAVAAPSQPNAIGGGSQSAAYSSSTSCACAAPAIADAFDIFDHGGNRTIDVRELGTVLRYLGYVPSQADLRELAVNVEDHEATGTVHLAAFLPYVENAISEYKYQPASASELLSAFRALDPDRTGMVSRECMESALRHDGEPFEDEELEEMMSAAAVETSTGAMVIPYELYINKILVTKWDTEQYGNNTTTVTTTNAKMSSRK